MSPDTILVSRGPGETRTALLAGDELVEIRHARDHEIQPGAVYAGRVRAKVPGIEAVFVDIGAALPGVLMVKGRLPLEGAAIAVAVAVPPRADKGADLRAADMPLSDKAPVLLKAAPPAALAWWQCYRDGIERILCAPSSQAQPLRAALGADAPVETFKDGDLFTAYGVQEAIEAALQIGVSLPSGGSLLIEPTAAVVAIDINSGSSSPAIANAEAMPAVARELRRRNIAGHIVVDLIAQGRGARGTLRQSLTDAVGTDPIATHVTGLTPLGMLELTRKREGLSLAETLCDASGALSVSSVALKLLRDAVRYGMAERVGRVAVAAAPDVLAVLQGPLHAALAEAEDMLKAALMLKPNAQFPRARFEFSAA